MNYNSLRTAIAAAIKSPADPKISGSILQQQLIGIVNALDLGALYLGMAGPNTTPNAEANGFYFATQAGTYTNFLNSGATAITVSNGEIALLVRSGNAWAKEHMMTMPYIDPTTKHWIVDGLDSDVVAEGQEGQEGQNAYVYIMYAASLPTADADIHSTPQAGDKWIGVYSGKLEAAPTAHTSYVWSKYVGDNGVNGQPGSPGVPGNGIASTVLNADYTLTITYTNGTNYTTPSPIRGPQGEQGPGGPAGPQGIKGDQGNTGANQDYAFELINNLTTDEAEKGLSAQQGVRLHEGELALKSDKLDKSLNVNLLDESKLYLGLLNVNTGGVSSSDSRVVSDFIPVKPGTQYTGSYTQGGSRAALRTSVTYCFYNANQINISGSGISNPTLPLTTPSGCAYVRINFPKTYPDVQFQKQGTNTKYVPYNPVYGYVHGIEEAIKEKLSIDYADNLFNKETVGTGYFASSANANINGNTAFRVSDFIKVTPGTTYHLSKQGDIAVIALGTAYYCLFDEDKKWKQSILAGNVMDITIPSDVHYIRFSMDGTAKEVMLTEGTSRPIYYQEYSEIAAYRPILRNNQVDFRHLTDGLRTKIEASSAFSRYYGANDSLATSGDGSILMIGSCHIQGNTLLVGRIKGSVTQFEIGVGRYKYNAFTNYSTYIAITNSDAKLYLWGTGGSALQQTITFSEEDFTWTNDTIVEIASIRNELSQVATLRITNNRGDVLEKVLDTWTQGNPYILNTSSNTIDAELSYYVDNLTARIWLFGDSYIGYGETSWTRYIADRGFDKWLLNGYPGQTQRSLNNSVGGYEDLVSLLSLGSIPTYVVWGLGMNGDNDTESAGSYTINSTQKAAVDAVVSLCSQYGIIPVFCTIPTVPERQRTGYNNYIRSLGYRYIDIADAVGSDSSGNWNEGLLSSDNVHPTQAGAKVIAARALLDFPEFAIRIQ